MKILITSDWYIPAVNGVVTSVKNLRRELELRGHEVRVLTSNAALFLKSLFEISRYAGQTEIRGHSREIFAG